MSRIIANVLVFLMIMTISETAWSKGETIRIKIKGSTLSSPLEITDPAIVGRFNIWNGPGVRTRGPDGVPHPPAYLDPSQAAGRFIDSPKGTVGDKPSGLLRFEVSFHIGDPGTGQELDRHYNVIYALQPSNEGGYLYLPDLSDKKLRNDLISHGVEGNWFYSTAAWENLVRPLIEMAAFPESGRSDR